VLMMKVSECSSDVNATMAHLFVSVETSEEVKEWQGYDKKTLPDAEKQDIVLSPDLELKCEEEDGNMLVELEGL
jgi:hypothetical protein